MVRTAFTGTVAVVVSALVATAAPVVSAQSADLVGDPVAAQAAVPAVDTQSADPAALSAPLENVDPSRYLPSPIADPWYSDPPQLDEATPNGTILDTRPATIPWFNAVGIKDSWQLLVQSRDSANRPVAVPSTVMIPDKPWTGPGPRPILSFASAIDGLGNSCQPSWGLTHKFNLPIPPMLQILVERGYGVVMTDHQGPRSAYGASRMHGHALLDGIRAVRSFGPAGLQDSPAALFGYSGGGIATGGAAQVQNTYAPEMSEYLVANAVGGIPVDLGEAYRNMDGTVGSGLLRAAVFGVAREYPEIYDLLNVAGDKVAYAMRDTCAEFNTPAGVVNPPIDMLTVVDDPLADPRVQQMILDTRVGPRADRPEELPDHPVLLFNADPDQWPGIGDQFFPAKRVKKLRDDWCELGVDVDYLALPGEHTTAMFAAPDPVLNWIDHRFALHADGRSAPNNCAR